MSAFCAFFGVALWAGAIAAFVFGIQRFNDAREEDKRAYRRGDDEAEPYDWGLRYLFGSAVGLSFIGSVLLGVATVV